jgi:hypothetical protein
MSEYGLSAAQTRGHPDQQYGAQPASNVEWYSSGSQQQQYSNYNYHEQSFASSSGAQYGTFEDEAPLLEGTPFIAFRILFSPEIYRFIHPWLPACVFLSTTFSIFPFSRARNRHPSHLKPHQINPYI